MPDIDAAAHPSENDRVTSWCIFGKGSEIKRVLQRETRRVNGKSKIPTEANSSVTTVTWGSKTKTEDTHNAVPASANCVFCILTESQLKIYICFVQSTGTIFFNLRPETFKKTFKLSVFD